MTSPVTLNPRTDPPTGWRWAPLTDVATLGTGHTPDRDRSDYWGGEIPWINLTEIRKLDGSVAEGTDLTITPEGVRRSSAVVHPAGTVAFSRTASVGFVTMMGRPMTTSQDFVTWTCGDLLDPRYLMTALIASREHLRSLSTGSTHRTIYMRVAERFHVLLPPLDEQRRIAAILDQADELRAKRRAAIAHLDSLTEAIFLDMFGDLPKIPTRPLGEMAAVSGGLQVTPAREANPRRVPYLRVANVYRRRLDLRDVKEMGVTQRELDRTRLEPDDLLFVEGHGNSAEVGRCARWEGGPVDTVHQNHLIRARVDRSAAHPRFVEVIANLGFCTRQFARSARTTSGLNTINITNVRELRVPVPAIGDQMRFLRSLDEIGSRTSTAHGQTALLNALFASLQARAFAGEL